jgi:hypothetical protein
MGLAYIPPGVQVSEVVTPSVNPLLAVPASVCVIGPAQGYVQRTDLVALTNEDNVRLPNLPAGATLVQPLVEVSNVNAVGSDYVENTDFVINYSSAANEVQTVTVGGSGLGGTFTLQFDDETTAAIAYNAAIGTVESALEALSNLETADVAVTGSAGAYTITFSGQYANTNVPTLVADGTALTGTAPTVTVLTVTEGGVAGTIRRVPSGAIAQGETVQVVYRYVPSNYYAPTRVDELSTVEELFGTAFNTDGTVNSEVSLAASIAFENGARDLVVQALFRRTSDGDPTSVPTYPTDAQIQDATTWEQSLYALRDIEDVNVLVPVIGQSFPGLIDSELYSIFTKVQDHVKFMADQQQYVIAILGEDSSTSSSVGQRSTIRAHVDALRSRFGGVVNEQVVFINTSKFGRINPSTSQKFYVGGQYVAAGFAGMLAGRAVSASLTREIISGFNEVAGIHSKADKNADAAKGLCVIEQRGNNVWIRHSTTTDITATQRREVPVVRAKHRMIESVRDTLENQVIGKVIADGKAPAIVGSAVGGVLERLKTVGDLVDYADIQARTLTLDPTTVEVRFSYKPAFPLNYINISFSIDLTGDEGVIIS